MKQLYYSLPQYMKDKYGRKLYKVALETGMTCPNRDGKAGVGGCIFCGEGGSGDFAIRYEGKPFKRDDFIYNHKDVPVGDYIAYFQSFTNTYAPIDRLEKIFTSALQDELFAGISIATRPDCVGNDVISLLDHLKKTYPSKLIWVELGLQTIHEETAKWMNRGYPLSTFDHCVQQLKSIGVDVIVHVILGLPNESKEMLLQTITHLNDVGINGVKLQLLHYLKGTRLGMQYLQNQSLYHVLTMEEYVDLVTECIAYLDSSIVIHRLTGDGNGEDLIAPLWSTDKRRVLNAINHELKVKGNIQGCKLV